jgi:hypothetical protein
MTLARALQYFWKSQRRTLVRIILLFFRDFRARNPNGRPRDGSGPA